MIYRDGKMTTYQDRLEYLLQAAAEAEQEVSCVHNDAGQELRRAVDGTWLTEDRAVARAAKCAGYHVEKFPRDQAYQIDFDRRA